MDTISSSSHLFVKLVWNSAVGSEDSLDVQMALYKTSLVKNFLRNVFQVSKMLDNILIDNETNIIYENLL